MPIVIYVPSCETMLDDHAFYRYFSVADMGASRLKRGIHGKTRVLHRKHKDSHLRCDLNGA
jgi:hypothetical protein